MDNSDNLNNLENLENLDTMPKSDLNTVVRAMKEQSADTLQFFDRETSDIVTVRERYFRIAADWGRISGFRSFPPDELDLITAARDIISDSANYISLPRRELIDYKKLMSDFIDKTEDEKVKKKLHTAANAILGNKYKRFIAAIERLELGDRWQTFIDGIYRETVRIWCEKNNILMN